MFKKLKSDAERFHASYLITSCGCHVWMLACHLKGAHGHNYGQFSTGSRKTKKQTHVAHRWIYEQLHGPIPPGMLVCHTCDIPECVNPDHLWLGTVKDNVDDMRAKGRNNYTGPNKPYKGPKAWSAKLTAEQVREMRQLFATGEWTKAALAERYGIHHVSVIGILRGDYWKHV